MLSIEHSNNIRTAMYNDTRVDMNTKERRGDQHQKAASTHTTLDRLFNIHIPNS